jgi:hypothetical protein
MTIEAFLSNYDLKVQEICLQLRKIVLELLPEMEEKLYEGWKNISYGTGESRSDKDLILYIAPFKDSVNLGFFRGTLLQDPHKLLKGTGKLLRHIKIKAMKDINEAQLREMILEAKNERIK